ncbi:MAG: PorV/PorQ family protein [Candidatus Kapabacteria bacterium]|nr:PorV/PorQ family protein [Candidatus Kapabacteria bacterium]
MFKPKSNFRFFSVLLVILISFTFQVFSYQSPYYFLRTTTGARSTGLAGSFVSIAGDITGLFFNPASIYTVEDKKFEVTFFKNVVDINSGNAAYLFNLGNGAKLATAAEFTNYGSFQGADNSGIKTSEFSSNDVCMTVVYSDILDSNLYYGVGLELLYNNIEKYSSTAFAANGGLFYRLKDKRTTLGLSILHAGMQISKFNGYSEKLPLDIRLGVSNRLRGLPLLINFSFNHLADSANKFFDKFLNFSLGGEFYFGKYLQVRAGYDNQYRRFTSSQADKKLAGFCAGIGLNFEKFNFDYGVAAEGSTEYLHKFSIYFNL